MDCKKVQDTLITDYADGELSKEKRAKIQAHLNSCEACRRYQERLAASHMGSFKNIRQAQVPAGLWQNIQARIIEEKLKSPEPFLKRLFLSFQGVFLAKRQVVGTITAFAFLLIMVLLIQAPIRKEKVAKEYIRQKSEYLLSLHGPVNGDLEQEVYFNSAIEKYLL